MISVGAIIKLTVFGPVSQEKQSSEYPRKIFASVVNLVFVRPVVVVTTEALCKTPP